jgi:hypothetical protein
MPIFRNNGDEDVGALIFARNRLFVWFIVVGLLTLLLTVEAAAVGGRRNQSPRCPCESSFQPPLVLEAGTAFDDLKIHLAGDSNNVIEAFFKDDLYREAFPAGSHLEFGRVILALRSANGTFAVRYGSGDDTLKVYGWRPTDKGSSPSVFGPVRFASGPPIDPKWVTPTILKVRFGHEYLEEFILQFTGTDANQGWRVLYDSRKPRP